MRRLATGAIGAALLLIGAGSASAEFLSGEEIKSVIGGKRVYLATGYGIEFPMQYARNGRVTGDGTGTGLGKYFAPKETGKWWVAGNQMCQRFPTWYEGRQLCFKLRKTGGATLQWQREDGKSGSARIAG
ncbi:MAG TPA: hypothetical protein VLQ68_12130 [Rhizobiaceae bacterium]|nr:hypothetical protein [Rhizobiaceae bacterium]